jgi:hypothetical protein
MSQLMLVFLVQIILSLLNCKGEETFNIFQDISVDLTASVNAAHKQWLYNLLKYYQEDGRWLAVQDQHGRIWSLHGEHFLLTNGFKEQDSIAIPNPPPIISEEDSQILSKLSYRSLLYFARLLGAKSGSHNDVIFIVFKIATKMNLQEMLSNVSIPK